MIYDVVIIGGGVAGLTAGLYAVRAGVKTLLFEKSILGGQIALTNKVENYPGFESISGLELAKKFKTHAEKFGLEVRYDEVISVENSGELKKIKTKKSEIEAKAVIIATGASPRKLGVPGEKELDAKGVHYCALCDGPLYKGKKLAVVGGGDSAVKEALFLTGIAENVILIHRRDKLKAEEINQRHILENKKIKILWNSKVKEYKGEKKLEKIIIENTETFEVSELDVDAVFVYAGSIPVTHFINVNKDKNGYISVDEHMKTSEKGIFAAGDCIVSDIKQVATCVGEGAEAAIHASEYAANLKK